MAAPTAASNANVKRGLAGGFLQALIRGVKPSSRYQAKAAATTLDPVDVANVENASVLTRAQKKRLSSDASGGDGATGVAMTTTSTVAAATMQQQQSETAAHVTRRALISLSNVQQQQQQSRRGSKRRSTANASAAATVAGIPGKRSRRQAAAPVCDGEAQVKLSQESNLGIRGLFPSSQEPQQQQQLEAMNLTLRPPVPVELCQDLAAKDSILASLSKTFKYLDHYPYALESFFLDQDLEEIYRRELPLIDFLQSQPSTATSQSGIAALSSGTVPPLRWDMLRVLFNWLISAHEGLELNYETLYMTVKLIYMYLSARSVPKQSLQLLAISALWIATKKEELFSAQLNQLTNLTLHEFSARQVIQMEQQILTAVDFRISWPLSYNFLRRYLRVVDHEDQPMSYLARYLLELSLLDHELNLERESAKAAAALWLARAQRGMRPLWPLHLQYSTAWTQAQLLPIARKLNAMSAAQLLAVHQQQQFCQLGRNGGDGGASAANSGGRVPLSNTFIKYSNPIFREVALTPALPSDSELLRDAALTASPMAMDV